MEAVPPRRLTSKLALETVKDLDEQIVLVSAALCPIVRGVPVRPDVDDATFDRLISLKQDLQRWRKETAALVHVLLRQERTRPSSTSQRDRERDRNARAALTARVLLEEHESLRA